MRSKLHRKYFWALGFSSALYFVYNLSNFSDKLHHSKTDLSSAPTSNDSNSKNSIEWCQPLHYLPNAEKRPVVALASCPGSGNTWLRYLLMQATGIYAGSVCRDDELENGGFSAEHVSNSSVSVVKTHCWGPEYRVAFDRAVLLVRSPYDAILAEFHLKQSGRTHTGHAAPEDFTKDGDEAWRTIVGQQTYFWYHLNLDWLDEFKGPMHIVLYEDLVTNLEPTLRRLVDFLEIPVSEDAIKCTLERREGLFHRKRAQLPEDLFSEGAKRMIEEYATPIYDKIRERLKNNQG